MCYCFKTRDPHSSKRFANDSALRSLIRSKHDPTTTRPVSKLDVPNIRHVYLSRVVVQYYSMVNKFGPGESHAVPRHTWWLLYLVAILLRTSKAIIEKCGHVCYGIHILIPDACTIVYYFCFISSKSSDVQVQEPINNLFIWPLFGYSLRWISGRKFQRIKLRRLFRQNLFSWMRTCWRQSSSEIRPSGPLLDHSMWNRQKNGVNTLWVDLMGQATCKHRLKGRVDIILRLLSILLKLSRKCWTNQQREFTLVPCQSCYFHVRTAPGPKPN